MDKFVCAFFAAGVLPLKTERPLEFTGFYGGGRLVADRSLTVTARFRWSCRRKHRPAGRRCRPGGPRQLVRLAACGLLLTSPFTAPAQTSTSSAPINIHLDRTSQTKPLFRVSGGKHSATEWRNAFAVYVEAPDGSVTTDQPPILGAHRIESGTLVFEPRFPLEPGMRYRAVLRSPGRTEPIVKVFEIPEAAPVPPTFVEHIYPSSNRLPENQLKFYIHFSASMSRGEAYRHVYLLDASGKQIDLPFLELDQELWDRDARRLTVFFDPGRVKRGLLPREEMGVPIEAGESYTLVVDRAWPDAKRRPLAHDHKKLFTVRPADREPPDLAAWQLTPPAAGTADALTVTFPEPLDHALLLRLLQVVTPARLPVEGDIQVDQQETRWSFTPSRPWQPDRYYLEVGTVLEDLAGNTLDRPFEVDVFERVEERIIEETRSLRFEVK